VILRSKKILSPQNLLVFPNPKESVVNSSNHLILSSYSARRLIGFDVDQKLFSQSRSFNSCVLRRIYQEIGGPCLKSQFFMPLAFLR
jgi:hypothetical protein